MEGLKIEKQRDPFTMIPNHLTDNSSLSFKAKGVYCHLKSKPDGWVFYVNKIAESSKDGVKSVRTAIDELEKAGYIVRKQVRNSKGEFIGTSVVVISDEKDLGKNIKIDETVVEPKKQVTRKKSEPKAIPDWYNDYEVYSAMIGEEVKKYYYDKKQRELFSELFSGCDFELTLKNAVAILRTDSEFERAMKRWSKSKTGKLNWQSRITESIRWSGIKVWKPKVV